MAPTVKIVGPYRFFFYANELEEPPHIHVRRDRSVAKYWLGDVALVRSRRFNAQELARIEQIVREHEDELREAWNGFSVTNIEPLAAEVNVGEHELLVDLVDGRRISVPLAWFPRLLHASAQQRNEFELIGDGEGIHWPAVDEDISVRGLVLGYPSVEYRRGA